MQKWYSFTLLLTDFIRFIIHKPKRIAFFGGTDKDSQLLRRDFNVDIKTL